MKKTLIAIFSFLAISVTSHAELLPFIAMQYPAAGVAVSIGPGAGWGTSLDATVLTIWDGITPSANMQTFLGNSTWAEMQVDLATATAISIGSSTAPDVTNGTTTLQPLFATAGTQTVVDFIDGDDHSEFSINQRFTLQVRHATIFDCSENANLECNGGQDFTGSATQLIDLEWRFDGTRWVCQNLITPMNTPTDIAISLLNGVPIVTDEVDGHADANLTAAQVSGTIVYNTGQAAADVALTLPTAASGYSALFTVATAQANKWGVRAGTNDKIYLLAADGTIAAGADNGYARMTAAQVGQSFACWTLKTDAYDWQCKAVSIGTSTFAAN